MNEINFNIEEVEKIDLSLDFAVKEIYPELEDLEVTPGPEEQVFTHEGSYGYDVITVRKTEGDYKEYIKNTISGTTSSYNAGYIDSIIKLPTFKNTGDSCEYMFGRYSGETIDLLNFNTADVKKYDRMFYYCTFLKEIIHSENINITSNAVTLTNMFYNCENLESVDTSNWVLSNATSISAMFYNCKKLKNIDTSKWNTGNISVMCSSTAGLFSGCESLEEIDVSNWDVSKVNYFGDIFKNCKLVKKLDISKWTNEVATGGGSMFNGCAEVEEIDARGLNMNKWSSGNSLFSGCRKLKSVKAPSYTSTTSGPTSAHSMFYNCKELKSVDLSGWITNRFTTLTWMFYNCTSLESVDLSNLDTSKMTSLDRMFAECVNLKYIDIRNFTFDKVTSVSGYQLMLSNVPTDCKIIVKDDTARNWIHQKQGTKWTNIVTVAELG